MQRKKEKPANKWFIISDLWSHGLNDRFGRARTFNWKFIHQHVRVSMCVAQPNLLHSLLLLKQHFRGVLSSNYQAQSAGLACNSHLNLQPKDADNQPFSHVLSISFLVLFPFSLPRKKKVHVKKLIIPSLRITNFRDLNHSSWNSCSLPMEREESI